MHEYGDIFSKQNTDVFKVTEVNHGIERVWTYNAYMVPGSGQEVCLSLRY